jgi:hypothetical protein
VYENEKGPYAHMIDIASIFKDIQSVSSRSGSTPPKVEVYTGSLDLIASNSNLLSRQDTTPSHEVTASADGRYIRAQIDHKKETNDKAEQTVAAQPKISNKTPFPALIPMLLLVVVIGMVCCRSSRTPVYSDLPLTYCRRLQLSLS